MAAIFTDGFDCYAAPADAVASYWDSGTTTSFTLQPGRFSGSQAIQYASTGAWLVKSSAQNDAVHHITCAFQQTSALTGSTAALYFQLSDGATNQCCIVFRSDGAILLTSATPGGTTLATYAGAVTATSTWYQFEFEVVINNTTGSFKVRKLGNTSDDHSTTGINTRPGANTQANKLTVGSNGVVSGQCVDDLLWRSDSVANGVAWAGDIRCQTRRPNADASVQWSRSGTAQTIVVTPNTTASDPASTARYTSFVANASGPITTIAVTFNGAIVGNCKMSLFADASGNVGAALGSATTLVNPATGSNTFTFPTPVSVVKGTAYWFGIAHDVTAVVNVNNGLSNAKTGTGVAYASFPTGSPTTVAAVPAGSTVFIGTTINADFVGETQQDAASSYVYSSTPDQSDLYTISPISSTPASIVCVTTRGYLQKSDAGTRLVAVQLKSGSTTVQSTPVALNTTWGWISRVDTVDPNGGGPLTAVGVNNMQVGVICTG